MQPSRRLPPWSAAYWWRPPGCWGGGARRPPLRSAPRESAPTRTGSPIWRVTAGRSPATPSPWKEPIIPEQFDETYSQYLELQASQGFDLTDYCGKRVKRYTYEITNYPTGESGIQAGLLVYKSTVIGGDVLSAQLGGFIHGLEMPA